MTGPFPRFQPLKAPLRRALRALGTRWRARQLRRGVARLRREARAGRVRASTLDLLFRGWGNPAFTADPPFLQAVADRALSSPGPLLDLGSGLTTLVAGVIAQQRGIEVWSVEQDPAWHARMRDVLAGHGVPVRLVHAPLRTRDDFAWYAVRGIPAYFPHVFCDGPAILDEGRWPAAVYRSWRYGTVPGLQALGVEWGEILLHDGDDPRCDALRARWEAEGVGTRTVPTAVRPYVLATHGDRDAADAGRSAVAGAARPAGTP